MSETYRSIARILKTHGRRGEVVAVPARGLPPCLFEGLQVTIVPPALKGPREREVLACSGEGGGQLVRLSGICDIDAASKLVGKTLLARLADMPSDFALADEDLLVGRAVTDVRHGSLGCVSGLMRGPAQDLIVVEGPYGEVLIPAVEAYLREVGESGPLLVEIPRGLLELATPPESAEEER